MLTDRPCQGCLNLELRNDGIIAGTLWLASLLKLSTSVTTLSLSAPENVSSHLRLIDLLAFTLFIGQTSHNGTGDGAENEPIASQ